MSSSLGSGDPFTRMNIMSMRIQGLWPVPSFGKKLTVLHRTFGVFITICYGFFTGTMFADVFMARDNLEALIGNLSISLLYFSGIVKAVGFLFTRNGADDLVRHAGEFSKRVGQSRDPKSMGVFDECVKLAAFVTYAFWWAAGLTILGFCAIPIFGVITGNRTEPSQLVFRAWNPFPDLWSGWLFHCIMICLTGVITATWTTLISVLIIIPTCELRILSIELQGMMEGKAQDLEGRVISWVDRHVGVIRYVASLDRELNYLLLLDFVIYAGIFCSILFQYTVMGLGYKSFIGAAYMVTMVTLQLLVYWTGNEIIIHSELLADAAYNSSWYRATPSYNTNVRIIMQRCQQPLRLRVWKLYDISLATFLKIISAAYSYFAILRHLYSKN